MLKGTDKNSHEGNSLLKIYLKEVNQMEKICKKTLKTVLKY